MSQDPNPSSNFVINNDNGVMKQVNAGTEIKDNRSSWTNTPEMPSNPFIAQPIHASAPSVESEVTLGSKDTSSSFVSHDAAEDEINELLISLARGTGLQGSSIASKAVSVAEDGTGRQQWLPWATRVSYLFRGLNLDLISLFAKNSMVVDQACSATNMTHKQIGEVIDEIIGIIRVHRNKGNKDD